MSVQPRLRSVAIAAFVLVLAISCGASAAAVAPKNSVVSKSIKNGQVKAPDLAKKAVAAKNVKPNALTGAEINELTLDLAVLQARITGSCTAGQAIRAIAQDGAVTCEGVGGGGPPTGPAGGELTGTYPDPTIATAFRLPQSCTNNQVPKSNGANSWACANDANSGGTVTSVGSGTGLSGGPITGSGTLSLASAYQLPQSCANGQVAKSNGSNAWSCQSDATGSDWSLSGNLGTNPATQFLGTTDNQALNFRVNNQRALRIEPDAASPNLIGGYSGNSVTAGAHGATISGGGQSAEPNSVTDDYGTVGGGHLNRAGDGAFGTNDRTQATVGGGYNNTASGQSATVGGGYNNTASFTWATVGGGGANTASGQAATVGGGVNNTASGDDATVGGGESNTAAGDYSFVAGRRAGNTNAAHDGVFLFADSQNFGFASAAANEFAARATGGVRFVTGINGSGTPTAGATLAAGSGTWSSVSDRRAKDHVRRVSARRVLRKLAHLPIHRWSYKAQDASIRHLGPMAQAFRKRFGLGEDRRHIDDVDAQGVALAAIKGLDARDRTLRATVRRQGRQIRRLERVAAAARR